MTKNTFGILWLIFAVVCAIGIYSVRVKNDFGKAVSEIAKLEVFGIQPKIFKQPQDKEIDFGQSAVFSIDAQGTGILDYQWYKNGQVINGANSNILKLDNITKADETIYSARIKNEFGKVISDIAKLTVIADPPIILTQPNNTEIDIFKIYGERAVEKCPR